MSAIEFSCHLGLSDMSLGLAVTEPVGLISQLGMFAIESVFYLVFVGSFSQLSLSAFEHVSKVNMSSTDPVCQAALLL